MLANANLANMSRKVLKDFTFSNGTTVPKGSRVCVATSAMHNDIANYPNPDVFDGFRFSEMRASEGESVKHQLVCSPLSSLRCVTVRFIAVVGCYQSGLCSFWARQTCLVRANKYSINILSDNVLQVLGGSSLLTS